MSVENYLNKLSDHQLKWAIQSSQEILKEREGEEKVNMYVVSDEDCHYYALPAGQWDEAVDAAMSVLQRCKGLETTPGSQPYDVQVNINVVKERKSEVDGWVKDFKWEPMSCCWCGKL